MKANDVYRVLALTLTAGLLAGAAVAQTTGRIIGSVTDEQKGVLPGVAVEARGPALQGSRAASTDASGAYRLTLLPPGEYEVTFTLQGFATETRTGVIVGLAKDTALDTVMRPAVQEALVVSGEVPVVDVASATIGTNLTTRAIDTLPTGRNYTSIVEVSPGTSSDASNNNLDQNTITVYGSSGAENAYFIDGVNTTGMEYGFQGKELNFEFIQEIDVKTGGYEAEYGRSTGGIINVITKSGGNEFHGDVFGYYDNDKYQASAEPVVIHARHGRGVHEEGFRTRPRRVHRQGQAVVLRRLRPRRQHDPERPARRPRRGAGRLLSEHARPGLRQADVESGGEPVADRHVLPGPAHRHRRDQRRQPHAQRRPADVRRPEGVRRPGLRAPLRRDLRRELGRLGPGRPPPGEEQRRTRERRRRHHPVPGPGQQRVPDRRVRPDRGEAVQAGLLRRLPQPLLLRPRDQVRRGVREGRGRRHQALLRRAAGGHLHQPG